MAYVDINFPTKKAFKEAIKNGETVYVQPDFFGGNGCYKTGKVAVEGPHYPQPHTWYADCDVDENNRIIKVR